MSIGWQIIKLFIEALFFVGMAGSLVVVVMTLVEDFQMIFQKDK